MLASINSAIKFYVSRLTVANLSPDQAGKMLANWGFERIGSGCESAVFSRKGFDFVIKIWHSPHHGSGPELFQQPLTPSMFAETFCFAGGGRFNVVIQKKVLGLYEAFKEAGGYNWNAMEKVVKPFLKELKKKHPKVGDLGQQNLGFVDGRVVAFDWSWDGCQ